MANYKRLDKHFLLPGITSPNLNGDYSGAEVFASLGPPRDEIWDIYRLLVFIEDDKIAADNYGNLGALGNGVELILKRNGTQIHSFSEGHKIKSNALWGHLCYDAIQAAWGVGNEFLMVRWTFARAGDPIELRGEYYDEMGVLLHDNLGGLIAHNFICQGMIHRNHMQSNL